MKRIIIIGGGASGLVSAIFAKDNNNEVIILEKNNSCGKKILITGNGKCNYFNKDFTINHYRSNNIEELSKIINSTSKEKILSFFNSIGIIPKIKDGYYYPHSNQAITIREALLIEAKLKHITIKYNSNVKNIEYNNKKFIITTNDDILTCDKVILSSGSLVAPNTGSDGFSYQILPKFNHTIIKPLPALSPIECEKNIFKECAGVRTNATITMIENNKIITTSTGEIQLTNTSISGICAFQLSGRINRSLNSNNYIEISINFLSSLNLYSQTSTINYLNTRNNISKNRTISQILDGILNYKLTNLILKLAKIDNNSKWNNLTEKEQQSLANLLTNFKVKPTLKYTFDKAQVCSGGVPLTEININTMQSKKQKNLYLTGELLDVDGDCGGYNLAFAWLSGIIAGTNAKKEKEELL